MAHFAKYASVTPVARSSRQPTFGTPAVFWLTASAGELAGRFHFKFGLPRILLTKRHTLQSMCR